MQYEVILSNILVVTEMEPDLFLLCKRLDSVLKALKMLIAAGASILPVRIAL